MEKQAKSSVKVIPAKQKKAARHDTKNKTPKLRVAAYCRVSTELEEQESSYEAQVSHYTELISSKHEWVLAGIYADEGISGTSTAGRENFNRMIADCEAHRIDMVITKSISRFARNTLDCLQYIRKLRDLEIPVLFEKENINTLGMGGELLVTIMASLAQQESQSISQNVRMGIHYNFQKGRPMLNHKMFLGYTKERGGDLKIVPEEAEIVRRIFRDYLEGMSLGEIVFSLEEEGVRAPSGKGKWYHSTITSMLKNEKYMGDLLLQKSYTADFLTKRKVRNTGTMPRYYVENAHEPIIPREIYMMTQAKLAQTERDRVIGGRQERTTKDMSLNGKLVCGLCGATYRRYAPEGPKSDLTEELSSHTSSDTWSEDLGTTDIRDAVWRCRTRVSKRNACMGPAVKEQDVKNAVVAAFNRLPLYRDELIRMQERTRWGPLEESRRRLRELDDEKDTLEAQYLELKEQVEAEEALLTAKENRTISGNYTPEGMYTGMFEGIDGNIDGIEGKAAGDSGADAASDPQKDAGGTVSEERFARLSEQADRLQEELDELEARIDEESERKANLAMQELQIQSALRLVDAINWNRDDLRDEKNDFCLITGKSGYPMSGPGSRGGSGKERNERSWNTESSEQSAENGTAARGSVSRDPAACTEVEDFYARTDNISQLGPVRHYNNDMVKRFIDKVIVCEDYLMVAFKAGIGIRIRKFGER